VTRTRLSTFKISHPTTVTSHSENIGR